MRRASRPPAEEAGSARRASAAPTLAELRGLRHAEQLFDFFGLEFDPRIVQAYRLHLIERFGLETDLIDREHPMLAEQERLALYREALRRSHQVFTRSRGVDGGNSEHH